MKAYLAEFVGTGVLVLFGDGVVAGVLLARSKAQNGGWLLIVTGWGLAVAVAAYLVGTVSGARSGSTAAHTATPRAGGG